MDKIGYFEFSVEPELVDFNSKIKIVSLFNLFLKCAGKHADQRDFGLKDLNENNLSWVLIRVSCKILKLPSAYQKITIETWVDSIVGLYSTRKFNVINENKEIIASASTLWMMIDITSRKPKNLSEMIKLGYVVNDKFSLIDAPEKIKKINESILVDTFNVRYSDIDLNKHTTSAKYLEWIMNYFTLNKYNNSYIKEFHINFISEILYDDSIKIYRENPNNNEYYFSINKNNSEKSSCLIKLIWSD